MESDRLILSLSVLITIITIIALGNPTITGYVPTVTHSQNLDIEVTQSQRFTLTGPSGNLNLSSLSISGQTYGAGPVRIYLTDGETRLLVYTNLRKTQSPMKHITGLAVSDLLFEPNTSLEERIDIPDGYMAQAGNFDTACMETCLLDARLQNKPQLYLDILIDSATLHLTEITFTTE